MARLKIFQGKVETPKQREILAARLDGIISSPTVKTFRAFSEKITAGNRDVLLDMRLVSYINSSGLGELLKIHDTLQEKNLSLVFVKVRPDVLRLIEMLGLGDVLNIFPGTQKALQGIDAGLKKPAPKPDSPTRRPDYCVRNGGFVPVVAMPPPRLPDARILLGAEEDSPFTRFLSRCLTGNGSKTVLVHSAAETRAAVKSGKIDLAIVERHLAEVDDICEELKCAGDNGLTPVIFICVPGETNISHAPCRVCEDENVIEPFEVRELIALAESEHGRCQEESILFTQEARLEIGGDEASIKHGQLVFEKLLLPTGLDGEDGHGFLHAVREALDNARRHGNGSDPLKYVYAQYIRDKEKVTVVVTDRGKGFDYEKELARAKNTPPIERARERHSNGDYGGLGISMMLRCCDSVEYIAPGNSVRLTKYTPVG